jgi:hypothetical protein
MRHGDSAAVINVAWLVIDKYRDAKAQHATARATRPMAVLVILASSTTPAEAETPPCNPAR